MAGKQAIVANSNRPQRTQSRHGEPATFQNETGGMYAGGQVVNGGKKRNGRGDSSPFERQMPSS